MIAVPLGPKAAHAGMRAIPGRLVRPEMARSQDDWPGGRQCEPRTIGPAGDGRVFGSTPGFNSYVTRTNLFVPESYDWIDSDRSSRGNEGSSDGSEDDDQGGDGVGHRVQFTDPEEETRYGFSQTDSGQKPNDCSDDCEAKTSPYHRVEYSGRRG